jgi:hypothetical protein
MRGTTALAVVALCLVACGDPDDAGGLGDAPTTMPATIEGTASSSTSSASSSSSSTSSSSIVAEAIPDAPDFSLALGGGGTFVLSEEARPVYLVFWAEW